MQKLWATVKKHLGITGFLKETTLWYNPSYKELSKLEGFQTWEALAIRYISQVYSQNVLECFLELQEEFA